MAYKTHPYNVANFFTALLGGTPTMTWNQPVNAGVSPPNVNTFRYNIIETGAPDVPAGAIGAGQMHLTLDFLGGVIGGNRANNFLAVNLPEGKIAGSTCQLPCMAKDNGGNWELVYCIVSEWSPTIYFRRANGLDWSAQSNLRLNANLIIEVFDPI